MEFVKIQKMGGIKCDNPNCTYRNESVDIGDYSGWIDKPCPLCGANLLTKEDYQAFQRILIKMNGNSMNN